MVKSETVRAARSGGQDVRAPSDKSARSKKVAVLKSARFRRELPSLTVGLLIRFMET
jgi:hypothetical protein